MSPRGVCTQIRRGSAREGAGAAGWGPRGRNWAGLHFLDACRIATGAAHLPPTPPHSCPGPPRARDGRPTPWRRSDCPADEQTWLEPWGPPWPQTFQESPGKRFQRPSTESARCRPGAEVLLRTQTVTPSQLGTDDLPPPSGHPGRFPPSGFPLAPEGGGHGDEGRSYSFSEFSQSCLSFPRSRREEASMAPLSKLSLLTS